MYQPVAGLATALPSVGGGRGARAGCAAAGRQHVGLQPAFFLRLFLGQLDEARRHAHVVQPAAGDYYFTGHLGIVV